LQQPGEIEKRLGKLPKDLKLAYDEIYNGMTEHERKIADRAFQWVMCAAKPLNTRELLPALCQDGTGDTLLPLDGLDEELALEYCHNLLVIDPVRKVWVPSHLSVIEYIEDHLWSQRQANSLVSSVCLLALQNTVLCNREEKWIMPDDMRGSYGVRWNPLSERIFDLSDPLDDWEFNYFTYYARHYWVIHAKKSAERGSNHRISTLVDEFLGLPADSSPAYRCWMRMVIEEGQRYPAETPQSSIFRDWLLDVGFGECIAGFVYCAFDLFAILPDWHDFDWVEQDQRTGTGQTFLELAAQGGAIHTCWELVKHGAEVNAQTNSRNGSPLAAAISNGQENVVEFLLKDGGADVNMQLKNQHGSALATASFQGQENMVRLLVKQGEAEVNMQFQNGFYGSALAVASYEGEWEIVKFLVKEGGAEVNMQLQYGEYGSALAAASYGGGWEVVKFLVKEGGAEVNMQLLHGEYGSALAAASYEGDWEVVKFLVKEGGAEVNMQLQHREYGSALAAASYGGDCEVVEFLVKEGGAEVNMQLQYGEYGSALAAASHGGHQEVIKFLIEEGGAEVNMQLQHGKYANALDAAEKWEWDEAAELLIKLGAERKVVEDKDNNESNSDGEWVSYADPKSDEE
jgi:ankyrin repeat protein